MQLNTFNNTHTKTYNRFHRGQKRSSTIGTRVKNTLHGYYNIWSGPKPSLKTLMRSSVPYDLRKAGTPKRRSRRHSIRHSRRHSRRNSRRH